MSALQPFPEARDAHRYSVYGLNVSSDFPLPELDEEEAGGVADVEIRIGRIPASDLSDGLQFGPDGALLRIADVASYLIRDGRQIVVEPQPFAADRNVRLYLLGSALGVLVHQRGLLPLHANAVEIDGKAVAFMGESGAGKSTLAAWLHDAGHRVIADDVCVLKVDDDGPVRVRPGLRRIRLWKDALERSGRETGDYELSWVGDETYEKFDVPISPEGGAAELDLAAIYLLSVGESFGISRLTAVDAADALFSHTYRGFVVSELGRTHLHFDAAVKTVRSTPVLRLDRSRDLSDLVTDISRIVEHAKQLIAR